LIATLIGPLGGLTNVIRYFALLGIPSAVLFGVFIDETRGVPLDIAAMEQEWATALREQTRDRAARVRAAE
jgi:hypothetical protein